MNTFRNKIWCVILSLAILVNLLPGSIFALATSMEHQIASGGAEVTGLVASENEFHQPTTDLIEEVPAVIVQEDVSLRNEFTKHFQMSDGSYTATVYNEPVHQLIDGEWVEVDNTLQLSTSAKGVTQYQTVNGLTDVSFAQTFGNELVTMEQDEHSITWGVVATIDTMEAMATESAKLIGNLPGPVQAEILPAELSSVSAEEQKTFATKASSTIQYSNALATGVDLEYTVLPSRIKESIILDSPKSISSYTVTVSTSNLLARLLDNREVEFYTEDGETVFTMWAPYMYDSASELSEDIDVELTGLTNGQYTITLTPNAEWINSPDRVYPIVIDPDVTVSRAKTNIIDNTVMEGQGIQNKNLDRLYIGRKSGACVRAFLKYDVMPTIPSNATITDATQTLYITSGTSSGSTAGAYIVTGGDWSSDTITWANRPTAATAIQASISHNNFSYYHFPCLNAVQKWYTGSTIGKNQNYGITVRYTDESINDYNAVYSADCSVESSRPLLTISYQFPISTRVYRIESNNGFYLGASGGLTNGTNVCIYSKATSGIDQLRQLWKVTHLGNGYYTLRPLHKLDMVLCAPTVNTVIWKDTAPDTLDTIANNHQWTISPHSTGDGYALKCTGSNGLALKPATPGSYSGLNAIVTGYSAESDTFRWMLRPVTAPPSGVLIYDTSTRRVLNDSTHVVNYSPSIPYSNLGITTSVYGPNVTSQTVRWTSRVPSVLMIAETTGSITATAPGTATLVAQSGGATGSFTLRTTTDVTLLALFDEDGETPEEHNDMRTYLEPAAAMFRSDGKYVYATSFDNMQKEQAIRWMAHTPVFFISTHGQKNSITIGDQQLTSNDLIGKDLSNLDLVVLLSCLTANGRYSATNVANGQPQNFVERLVCCGAETVVGFDNFVVTNDANTVGTVLPRLLAEGFTIQTAMDTIARNNASGIAGHYIIGGNSSLRIY